MTVTEIDAPVAMMASSPSIPVIDLSQDDEGVLIEALLHAFTTIGFCTLINHGVSQPLIAGAFEASRAFFTCLPTETKLKYKYRDQTSNRGYIPFGSESHLSYTEASNSDRKETMDIGWDDEPGFTNLWPTEEELPSEIFKDILLEYFDIMDTLQLKLMRYIGMGLRLPDPNYLVDRCNGKHENLRLLHYPGFCGSGREASRMRGNAHTDFGTITLLVQDQVGGLKVRRKDGVWLFVEPVENSIIVNVGDMLMRWSNDRLKATLHQVETPPSLQGQDEKKDNVEERDGSGGTTTVMIPERFSIAFFANANKNVDLECLETCYDDDDPVKYPPINAYKYITQRLIDTIKSN